jgi:HAD superfamily hydrolase (TIGR01509 family)
MVSLHGATRHHRFRAVLFDFDHTLFQFDDSIEWPRVALDRLGRSTDPTSLRELYERMEDTRRRPEVIEQRRGCQRSPKLHRAVHDSWFQYAGADSALAQALYNRLMDPAGWTPYRDVVPTLTALHRSGVPMAIVSNVGWDIRPIFEHHGLGALIGGFALSCEHGSEKPEQTLFLAACEQLGIGPDDALMVGDDPVNDGAAVRSGMHVYLLPDQPMGATRGLAPVYHLAVGQDPRGRPPARVTGRRAGQRRR